MRSNVQQGFALGLQQCTCAAQLAVSQRCFRPACCVSGLEGRIILGLSVFHSDWHAISLHRISDPDAAKPDDWDEDAPMMVPDEDAEKPAGWLDDEPSDMPDPGRFHARPCEVPCRCTASLHAGFTTGWPLPRVIWKPPLHVVHCIVRAAGGWGAGFGSAVHHNCCSGCAHGEERAALQSRLSRRTGTRRRTASGRRPASPTPSARTRLAVGPGRARRSPTLPTRASGARR